MEIKEAILDIEINQVKRFLASFNLRYEENIDKTYNQFSSNHLERLKHKSCVSENSVAFTKILTDFERIGDHSLNIAQHFSKLLNDLSALKMIHAEE